MCKSGSFVSTVGVESLTERFSDILRLSNITVDQLTEARLEISLVNLKYFMKRMKKEDLQGLEDCLAEAARANRLGLSTREKNILFHQLIALGSKNPCSYSCIILCWKY